MYKFEIKNPERLAQGLDPKSLAGPVWMVILGKGADNKVAGIWWHKAGLLFPSSVTTVIQEILPKLWMDLFPFKLFSSRHGLSSFT